MSEIIQVVNTLNWPGAVVLVVFIVAGAWVAVSFIKN